MNIACIGFGSLIWDPRRLIIQSKWFEDGPLLPVEFTRISKDGRVTLIIDEKARKVRALWSLMTTKSLEEGQASLSEREGCQMETIHFIQSDNVPTTKIEEIVKNWMNGKDLDAAIWTGLSYSEKTNYQRPSIEDILTHLDQTLDRSARVVAEEYIRRAPKQIDTEYRRMIEQELGWSPLEL